MKRKYKIGVLFCGGCNCYYDREAFFSELKVALSEECEFEIYREKEGEKSSETFDLMLLINGCQSECLISADYGTRTLLLNNKNCDRAAELIRGALSGAT